MSAWKRLVHEAHRRSLWQVLGVYAAGSWVAFEVIGGLVDAVGLPEWFPAAALVLFLIGLPIVLATAFVQEGPPRPSPGDSEQAFDPTLLPEEAADPGGVMPAGAPAPATGGTVHRLLTWRNAVLGGVGAFAVWGLFAAGWLLLAGAATGDPGLPKIVVLPFENLGAPEDEYFADGITEELTSRLAESPALQVISRTSALQYKNAEKNLRQIGLELDVDYVLEGTIRWEKAATGPSRIRVTPQLIRVSDDTHLWTERYDAVLAEVFRVQEQIARQVTVALASVLGDTTVILAEAAPATENLEAYDFYLRAHEYFYRRFDVDEVRTAADLYEEAVERDPTFAAAWERLVRTRVWLKHNFGELDQLPLAAEALARLERVAPGSVEARIGRGFYEYYGARDFAAALREFEALRPARPNDVDVISAIAFLHRRLGRWDEAVAGMKQAFDLDPRSSPLAFTIGQTLASMRRPDEAEPFLQRAIALEPQLASYWNLLVDLYAFGRGDTAGAWQVAEEGAARVGQPIGRGLRDLLRRDYASIVARLQGDSTLSADGTMYLAWLLERLGRGEEARPTAEEALRLSREELAAMDTTDPALSASIAFRNSTVAWSLAILGDTSEAERWAERSLAAVNMDTDALTGDLYDSRYAALHAYLGNADRALDTLEKLLSVPSSTTIYDLRLDPLWDPLRDNPRFQRLIAEQRLPG